MLSTPIASTRKGMTYITSGTIALDPDWWAPTVQLLLRHAASNTTA